MALLLRSGRPLPFLFWQPTAIKVGCLGHRLGTFAPPLRYIFVSSIVARAVIACSLSLHLIWNPNGAFEHVVKEWKAITSLLWRPEVLKVGCLGQICHFGPTFEVYICVQYCCTCCYCQYLVTTSYMEPPNGAFEHVVKEWKAITTL